VFVEFHIFKYYFLGAVCRAVVAIDSYEGPSKNSKFVEARFPDVDLLNFRSAITTSRKVERPRNRFLRAARFLKRGYRVDSNLTMVELKTIITRQNRNQ
jgi:hypothetical protein